MMSRPSDAYKEDYLIPCLPPCQLSGYEVVDSPISEASNAVLHRRITGRILALRWVGKEVREEVFL